MKHLTLILCLTLVAFLAHATAAFADFDSDKATIKKSSDTKAKVLIGSKTYTTPISFGDGASWDNVKDHYEVSPVVSDLLAKNEVAISIGSDGAASFTKRASHHFKKK